MNSHPSHSKYRPDIDGLRAIAVLSVVAFHAFPNWVKGGFIGVDVFFVISGYLISTIIFENLDKGTFSFGEFYSRRVRRIFPALLLVLTISYVLGWFTLLADEYKQLGRHIAGGVGFVSNFVLWKESSYFDNAAETKPLLHLWSLGIEEQFYIVYPLLLWFTWKRKFNLLTVMVTIALTSFILNVKGVKSDSTATFFSPQTRFWELMFGGILAWGTLYKADWLSRMQAWLDRWLTIVLYRELREFDRKTLSNVASFLGLLMLVYGFFRIDKELSFPGKWALVPVLGSIFIILASQQAWINRKILSNRILVWFGLISFPLYLWHWVMLSFARVVESEVPSRNIRIAAVMFSIFLAWLTYELVERPIRFGRYNKIKVAVLVVSMSLLGASGYCVYQFDIKSPAAKRILLNSNQLGWTIPVGSEEQIALCRKKFPERSSFTSTLRDDNFCYLQKNSTPNVLLIGDSMNLSLFSALSRFDDLNVLMLSASTAAPFYDVRTTELGDNIRLNNYLMTNQALDYAIDNSDIKVVLLSSLEAPSLTDQNKTFTIWDVNALNETNQHKIFINAMTNTIQRLLAANKRVIYVMPNPTLEYDPKLCLSNLRPFRLTNKRGACFRSAESVNSQYKAYREWVNDVLRNFPQVTVFDPYKFFCDEDNCYGSINSKILYRDNAHLSINGSDLIAQDLHNLINQQFEH